MWTSERVTALKALWAGGASAQEISWEMGGVTRSAVLGKLDRLGLLGTKPRTRAVRAPKPHVRRERRERRERVKPSRYSPSLYFRRPVAPVQTKSEIAAEFAQIWANTVAIQTAMGTR